VANALLDVTGRLGSASGGMDWSGYAQSRYMSAAGHLCEASAGAAEAFATCALATARYAEALERAQGELRRMRGAYEAAVASAASARASASWAASAASSTVDPVSASSLSTDAARYENAAGSADADAEQIRRRAVTARAAFDEDAATAASAFRPDRLRPPGLRHRIAVLRAGRCRVRNPGGRPVAVQRGDPDQRQRQRGDRLVSGGAA
jgi:hypothetical protein